MVWWIWVLVIGFSFYCYLIGRESLEYIVIVNEVNFDLSGEDVGICFDDSSVVISSFLIVEKDKFEDYWFVNVFVFDLKYVCKVLK